MKRNLGFGLWNAEFGLRVLCCGQKGHRARGIAHGEKDQKGSGLVRMRRMMNDEQRMTSYEGIEKKDSERPLIDLFEECSDSALVKLFTKLIPTLQKFMQ